MHYDALELAKYMVVKCMKEGHPISNMRLQFLLYIVQREFLQVKNRCAYYDETQAWAFGPCVRNVYAEFCGLISFKVKYIYTTLGYPRVVVFHLFSIYLKIYIIYTVIVNNNLAILF